MYWSKKGAENTEATIDAALKRAEELGINHIVVASNTGETAEKILEKTNSRLVCVTHHFGFKKPGEVEITSEMREKLTQKGASVLTTTHLMAGIDRAVRFKFGGLYPAEIAAATLRMFGEGPKVCVEIAGMALDAGLIPFGEEIIAVAGSGRGADTACVIVPAHSNYFFDTAVKEIICKPRER